MSPATDSRRAVDPETIKQGGFAFARADEPFRRRVAGSIGLSLGILAVAAVVLRYLIASIPGFQLYWTLALATLMLLLPVGLRRGLSIGICSLFLTLCLDGIALAAGFGNGGMKAPATILFVITPIIGFFCNGKAGARAALGLSIACIFGLLWGEQHSLTDPINNIERFSQYKAAVFTVVAAATYALGAAYERSREIWEKALTELSVRAAQSSKLSSLGEMAAGIAHEINNPLAAIQGRAQLLRLRLESDEPLDIAQVFGDLEMIEDTVQRTAKIIKGMKSLSRDAEHDEMSASRLDIIFDDVLELCEERFRLRGIEIRVSPAADRIALFCRPTQISQVLMNLLNNSFDAVEKLPVRWVELNATVQGKILAISVTDSGTGISPDIAAKVMQPLFSTKSAGKGTGLGLSISRAICRQHQGELKYDATCPNTRFVIELPLGALDSTTHII